MTNKRQMLIIGIFVIQMLSWIIIIPLTPVASQGSALSLSYPSLHFYMNIEDDTEQIFADSNFYFKVTNKMNESAIITGTAEVLHLNNWQSKFRFEFPINHQRTDPNQSVTFYPRVYVNTNLSFEYFLHFVFNAYPVNAEQGNRLIGSAGATPILSVNAEIPASTLEIQTTDQGGKERKSKLEILFNKDKPEGYSAFRSFAEISYFRDIVPHGYYWIRAIDLETNLTEIQTVHVDNSTFVNLKYKIIAFLPFQLLAPRTPDEFLLINYTVINQYRQLSDVTVQMFVQDRSNQTLKDAEVTNYFPTFGTETFRRQLNVSGVTWSTGTYYIRGFIYVGSTLYLEKEESLKLNFDLFEELFKQIQQNPYTPLLIVGIFGVLSGVGMMMMIPRLKIRIQTRKKKKEDVTL